MSLLCVFTWENTCMCLFLRETTMMWFCPAAFTFAKTRPRTLCPVREVWKFEMKDNQPLVLIGLSKRSTRYRVPLDAFIVTCTQMEQSDFTERWCSSQTTVTCVSKPWPAMFLCGTSQPSSAGPKWAELGQSANGRIQLINHACKRSQGETTDCRGMEEISGEEAETITELSLMEVMEM